MSRFWAQARIGAAREFGRRHYKWFAGLAIARRLAPALVVLVVIAAVAASGWAVVHSHLAASSAHAAASWARPLLTVAVTVLVAVLLVGAWRRWGLVLGMYWPTGPGAAPAAAAVLGLVVVAGAAFGTWTLAT